MYVLQHCLLPYTFFFFFFNDTATTEIYTLSLHDALPISDGAMGNDKGVSRRELFTFWRRARAEPEPKRFAPGRSAPLDRKSTRLNSSHSQISYAVFCLKKKKITMRQK